MLRNEDADFSSRKSGTGIRAYSVRLRRSFSTTGLLFATLFFAASLTPSLMPRTVLIQGALSGFSAAAGYALGAFLRWLWTYLELREPSARVARTIKIVAAVVCLAVAVAFLWKASEWQNTVRELMGMERVETADPLILGMVAAAIFAGLVLFARLFNIVFGMVSRWLQRYVPRRVSNVIGGLIAVALFWSVAEGIFFRMALRTIDNSLRQLDALIDDDIAAPVEPMKTGSSASLVDWHDLGRQGRRYVVTGPTAADIDNFFQGEALEPIRVYVGLNSAETAEERARLALEEMKRVGAFDRSILVVVVPTGTGWVDPAAMDTLEYLHRGDVASVAMQYSYLLSWLSLLFEPGYGAETGNALFKEVYGYWTTLPHESRPKLYLHGLSLGSMNSEVSADLLNVIGDPFQGALWSGPPFPSSTWKMVTENRIPGSPAWLPRFRDGSVIRFTNQNNALDIPGARWGPIRIVYLQYASDPVTFFDPKAFYREPDWMKAPRGPDVSPALRWYPGITMLQLAFDMTVGTTSPIGYGHVYAPQHYIDGWMAVTDPPGVTQADIDRLKEQFEDRY